MSIQLVVIGPKPQDLVISFCIGEVKTLIQFRLRSFQIRSEIFLLHNKTGQIKNLTGKYIMELSTLKHLQRYMNPFELDYRNLKRSPQIHQLSTTFTSTIEEVVETLDKADIYMILSYILFNN